MSSSPATKAKRCTTPHYKKLRQEIEEQTFRAAREILQANVDRARQGSLAHTKWLFSLIEQTAAEGHGGADVVEESLARRLLLELTNEK